jgi:transcription antitermination protein NusB
MSGALHTVEARHWARLFAVQALYQMELGGAGHEAVIREFEDHRFGEEIDDLAAPEADRPHFERVVRGVIARQAEIDQGIDAVLRVGWPLARLDATVRAVLRAGAFELIACPDIPPRVVLNEYVELAGDFFSGEEPGFINGVLDGFLKKRGGTASSLASG